MLETKMAAEFHNTNNLRMNLLFYKYTVYTWGALPGRLFTFEATTNPLVLEVHLNGSTAEYLR